jgi:hypothetical protein
MPDDKGFMERDDWMVNGRPFCKVFCPVSVAERAKRLKASERRSLSSSETDLDEAGSSGVPLSALAHRYDWDLHQMVGYMRRLDGATQTLRKLPRMNPLAKQGEPTWATDGKLTPYFGYWTFVAWNNVFAPVLQRMFGGIANVVDDKDLDELLDATVMM